MADAISLFEMIVFYRHTNGICPMKMKIRLVVVVVNVTQPRASVRPIELRATGCFVRAAHPLVVSKLDDVCCGGGLR